MADPRRSASVTLIKVMPLGRMPRLSRFVHRHAPDMLPDQARRAAYAALKRTHADENVMCWEVDPSA